jgi:cardiolipin synthase
MERLLDAVAAVVRLVSPEKVQSIANRIRQAGSSTTASSLPSAVGTPAAAAVMDQLVEAWRSTSVGADELALMLLAAGHVVAKVANQQSTELVWTGPTTPFVSARRTEQALLQVINAAKQTLFITSFVAYDVSTIVRALNDASARGVAISILLELSQDHGGAISFDAIGKMSALVPPAKIYAWRDKAEAFSDGRVHAKVAAADGSICFITSANLTGYAMERNMEAGLLINGGDVPATLHSHLQALVDLRVVHLV